VSNKILSSIWAMMVLALLAVQSVYAQGAGTLRIAAAADLQPVLPPIISEFQSRTGLQVAASYASSATLAAQIINGGPFDLFLAADTSFPEKVIAAGLADSAHPIPYARGTLVLWTRNDSPILKNGGDLSIDTLRNPALRRIAIANPEHAPYGRAAVASLKSLDLADSLKDRLVIAENIAQAAQYVESGNAEVGLISLTSAVTPRMKDSGRCVEMPSDSYPPILQGAVVVKSSAGHDDAHKFLEFLLSPEIREQLKQRGLGTP
jgi:molybdate transport system substrate-binding protein